MTLNKNVLGEASATPDDRSRSTQHIFPLAVASEHSARVMDERDVRSLGSTRHEMLATEMAISISFNGTVYAVVMATPSDLAVLTIGFALSEGILDHPQDCLDLSIRSVETDSVVNPTGMEVELKTAPYAAERLRSCGDFTERTASWRWGRTRSPVAEAISHTIVPPSWIDLLNVAVVLRAVAALPAERILNAQVGVMHAAAWSRLDSKLTDVLEDVSAENALNKLLGTLARGDRLSEPGFVVMTGHGSRQILSMASGLGVAALATLLAPTAGGVAIAESAGMQLWGHCASPRAVLYAGKPK